MLAAEMPSQMMSARGMIDRDEYIIEIAILPGAVVQRVDSRFRRQVHMVRRGFCDVGSAASPAISATRQEA